MPTDETIIGAPLVAALSDGRVLLLHCDTVYGLLAKAPSGYRVLQKIKGRPENKPFLQLFADTRQLAESPWRLPPATLQKYWPGPLTCVLSPKPDAQNMLREPYCDSQAVRIPDHALLQALCRAIGGPLYSTSANRSGKPTANDPKELKQIFAPEIASGLIVPYFEPEPSKSGLESTIVDARLKPPRLLRKGVLDICESISPV